MEKREGGWGGVLGGEANMISPRARNAARQSGVGRDRRAGGGRAPFPRRRRAAAATATATATTATTATAAAAACGSRCRSGHACVLHRLKNSQEVDRDGYMALPTAA